MPLICLKLIHDLVPINAFFFATHLRSFKPTTHKKPLLQSRTIFIDVSSDFNCFRTFRGIPYSTKTRKWLRTDRYSDRTLNDSLLFQLYLKRLLTGPINRNSLQKTLPDSRTILIAVSSGFDYFTGEEMQKSFVGFTDYGQPVGSLFFQHISFG